MEILTIKNKNDYTMKTDAGRQKLREFIKIYNEQGSSDILFKNIISLDEALALTNIEEFIRTKSNVAEIVREALEIGLTTTNFTSNTIFTFTRNHLKKAGFNSVIRLQVELYIKARLHLTDKQVNTTAEQEEFKNITCFNICGQNVYCNILTGEELESEKLKKYLAFIKNQEFLEV